jgi:hypothetical protein
MSDDLKHSNQFVQHVLKTVIEKYDTKMPFLSHVHVWSDGCCSQFKSTYHMHFLSNIIDHISVRAAKLSVVHNFFCSCHGKGPSDSEGAVVKTFLRGCEFKHNIYIRTSHDAFTLCSGEHHMYCGDDSSEEENDMTVPNVITSSPGQRPPTALGLTASGVGTSTGCRWELLTTSSGRTVRHLMVSQRTMPFISQAAATRSLLHIVRATPAITAQAAPSTPRSVSMQLIIRGAQEHHSLLHQKPKLHAPACKCTWSKWNLN